MFDFNIGDISYLKTRFRSINLLVIINWSLNLGVQGKTKTGISKSSYMLHMPFLTVFTQTLKSINIIFVWSLFITWHQIFNFKCNPINLSQLNIANNLESIEKHREGNRDPWKACYRYEHSVWEVVELKKISIPLFLK